MNYDVMIYALKVVRNHEFSGQVRMLSPAGREPGRSGRGTECLTCWARARSVGAREVSGAAVMTDTGRVSEGTRRGVWREAGRCRVATSRTGRDEHDEGGRWRPGPVQGGSGPVRGSGTVWANLSGSGPVWTGLGRFGLVWAGLGRLGRSGPVWADGAGLGRSASLGRSGPGRSGLARLGRSGAAWTDQARLARDGLAWSGAVRPVAD